MAQFPAMPFWFDAYYRDTQHLTYEEHGIYLHIIKLLWHAPAQRIPNDPKWIRRRFGKYTLRATALIKEFCICDGNWITQSKVMREWQYLAEKSEKATVSANIRWNKEKDICDRNANAMLPTPTPIGLVSKKEASNGTNGNGKVDKGKPRHRQASKRGRIWLDVGTDEFVAYAADYWGKHHARVPLLWNDSGAWFNTRGEQ